MIGGPAVALGGVAERRFRRVGTFALGASMTITSVADIAIFQLQAEEFAAWWWYPVVLAHVLGALAFLILPWVSDRATRVVTLGYVWFSLAMLVTLLPAAGLHGFPDELGAPWPLRLPSTFGVAAALTLPVRWVWALVGAEAVLVALSRWLGSESGDPALSDSVVTLSVTIPFVLLTLAIVKTGRQLDLAAAGAIEATRREAAGMAIALERRRIELLAHDHIMHTLRAASLGLRSASTTPATLARSSLDRLDRLDERAGGEPSDVMTGTFLERLRSLTTQLAPDAEFVADLSEPGALPPDAADALLEATGEALRNSVAYAGADRRVRRGVHVRLGERSVRVSISDDGRGFRLDRVRRERLGVARSIIERMRSLPGGGADVVSAPGRGTSVELRWEA